MADQLTFRDAMGLLGLDTRTTDPAVVRAAYLDAVRRAHPDHNPHAGATAATATITVAYRVVIEALAAGEPVTGDRPRPTPDQAGEPPHPTSTVVEVEVTVIADDTIEVAAPPDLAFAWLVQTGHVVGDVTFLDRSAALLQILVSFVDEPVCQMIFDLQGRAARGTTEIFCTIDSIEDREAPPITAVTQFIADHLVETISAG